MPQNFNQLWDSGSSLLTFGPLEEVDLQDGLWWGLSSPDQEPDHGPGLLQGLHRPAVDHLGHVHLVHTQHTVVDPGEGQSGYSDVSTETHSPYPCYPVSLQRSNRRIERETQETVRKRIYNKPDSEHI